MKPAGWATVRVRHRLRIHNYGQGSCDILTLERAGPMGFKRPAWPHLIKACTALKSGCSAVRSHSNTTISVVTNSAPAPARRS